MPGIGMFALARTAPTSTQSPVGGTEFDREGVASLVQRAGRRQERDLQIAAARPSARPGQLDDSAVACCRRA